MKHPISLDCQPLLQLSFKQPLPKMIRKILAVPCFGLLASLSFAQEAASVLGPISDGSPSPAAPPPFKIETAQEDILETKVREQGGRKIIIQKVTPVELPPIPEPVAPTKPTPEQRAAWEARRLQMKKREFIFLSATVYRSPRYPGGARTQFRLWSKDRKEPFEVWSNVDGQWMGGFANFQTPTTVYSVCMGIGALDVDRIETVWASKGRIYTPPIVPEIQEGEARFVVTKGSPTADELAPIRAIHNLYNSEGEKLHLAFEGRVRAQKERAEFLKANPPKPQDIVIRYWRIEKPATAGQNEGGAR